MTSSRVQVKYSKLVQVQEDIPDMEGGKVAFGEEKIITKTTRTVCRDHLIYLIGKLRTRLKLKVFSLERLYTKVSVSPPSLRAKDRCCMCEPILAFSLSLSQAEQ